MTLNTVFPQESIDRAEFAPEVGFRLAALADGEGSFIIARQKSRTQPHLNYTCIFAIKLRADDTPFLERMRTAVGGPGAIYHGEGDPDPVRRNSPWASWRTSNRDETLRLVAIFDAYPLWSKKAAEYAIWREAVLVHSRCQPERTRPILAELFQKIRDQRAYVERRVDA